MSRSISVIEPVSLAIDTTKRLLFAPFDIVKWLGLGFTAWLAMLSGGSSLPNVSSFLNNGSDMQPLQAAWSWTLAHLALVISLAVCAGVFIVAVSLAIGWVSSRGKFMFLDNVVRNRAEIAEPWTRTRAQGNSYFLFSICLGLASLALLGIIVLTCVLVASPDITRNQFGANAIVAIILGVILLGLYGITLTCAMILLDDFIVPIMALRSCRALAAWREFFELFKANTGIFIIYMLFKIVLGWAVGAISIILCCCLCCVMWIPYIGTVILLPLFVFLRCYSLHFLEQFGKAFRSFHIQSIPANFITVGGETPTTP
jgi:hypothetical protein